MSKADTIESAFDAAVAAATEGSEAEAAPEAEEMVEPEAEATAEAASSDAPEEDAAEAPAKSGIDAARAAFDSGDVEALAKALGSKAPKLDNPAFVRMRKAENLVKEAQKEREKQAELLAEARRQYGPMAKARVAARQGDLTALRKLIEDVAQKPLEQLIPGLSKTRAESGEIADLRKELDALKKRAGTVSRHNELSKHPVTALPDWEDEIDAAVDASFDAELGDVTLTPREAADAIVAKARKVAGLATKPAPKDKTRKGATPGDAPAKAPRTQKERDSRDYERALAAASVPRKARA